MTKSVKIENGVVTNVIVGEQEDHTLVPADTIVGVGWAFDGERFTPPTGGAMIAPLGTITRAQLIDVLLDRGTFEHQVTAMLENANYPDDIAKARAMNAWQNATEYRPDHPMVTKLRIPLGLADDDEFRAAWLDAQQRMV